MAIWCLTIPITANIGLFNVGSTEITISRLLGMFLVGIVSILVFFIRPGRIPALPLAFIIIFLIYLFAHVFFGSEIFASFLIFIRAYGAFCILILFLSNTSFKLVHFTNKALVVIGAATAIYTIVQLLVLKIDPAFAYKLFGKEQFWGGGDNVIRPIGILLSAGGSASLICIALVVLIKRWELEGLSIANKILFVILLVGLLCNFTRTFILMFALYGAVILLYYKRFSRLITLAFLGLVVVSSYVSYVGVEKVMSRFQDVPSFSQEKVDDHRAFEGRGLLIEILLSDFQKQDSISKLIGNELNWSGKSIQKYYKHNFRVETGEASAHNDYIWLLVNLGYIGLLLYLLLAFNLYKMNKYEHSIFYRLFIVLMFIGAGFGGESIAITGHRYFQMLLIANMYNEDRLKATEPMKKIGQKKTRATLFNYNSQNTA